MEADIMRQKEAAEAAKRKHKLELVRLGQGNRDERMGFREDRAKAPKLPSFVDGKDDLNPYLQRFERFAQLSGMKLDGHRSSVLCCLDEHSKCTHSYLRKQLKIMTR